MLLAFQPLIFYAKQREVPLYLDFFLLRTSVYIEFNKILFNLIRFLFN